MSPYLLTLAFLTMMSCFTASQVTQFSETVFQTNLFDASLSHKKRHEELLAFATLEDKLSEPKEAKETVSAPEAEKKETHFREEHPPSLRFNLSRPPNNSRLNFYSVLFADREETEPPFGVTPYELAARLLRLLYGEASFYHRDLEYQILDQLIEKKEKAGEFIYPDELAEIVFSNPTLQEKFYLMLRGTETTPSLLDFITFDAHVTKEGRKINLLFTNEIVLKALFSNHPGAVAELVAARNELLQRMKDQEEKRLTLRKEEGKGRKGFKEELKLRVEEIALNAGLKKEEMHKAFDYSLGKYGTVLFVKDPVSGVAKREKYKKREKVISTIPPPGESEA